MQDGPQNPKAMRDGCGLKKHNRLQVTQDKLTYVLLVKKRKKTVTATEIFILINNFY